MDNADLRALLLGAMKTAYEAGHHATVEGHYHEEWPDDHVDDWMDDEGITAPGYVRVPVGIVENLNNLASDRYASYIENMRSAECLGAQHKMQNGCFGEVELNAHLHAIKFLGEHRAFAEAANMLTAAAKETPND